MASLADILGMGGMPSGEGGIPMGLLDMLGGRRGMQEGCFPREEIAKCKEAGEQALRDSNIKHFMKPEHLGHLSQHIALKIQSIKTGHALDREFIADKDELPKWQLVRSEEGKIEHVKSADYVVKVEGKVAVNAARIETLEALHILFADTHTKAMAAAEALRALNANPTEEGVALFKEGVLKTYSESKKALEDRISEIAGTIPQQQMFQLLPGVVVGPEVVLSPAQKGAEKALDLTKSAIKSLDKYEGIVRSCLAGIEATFEEVQSEEESSEDDDTGPVTDNLYT